MLKKSRKCHVFLGCLNCIFFCLKKKNNVFHWEIRLIWTFQIDSILLSHWTEHKRYFSSRRVVQITTTATLVSNTCLLNCSQTTSETRLHCVRDRRSRNGYSSYMLLYKCHRPPPHGTRNCHNISRYPHRKLWLPWHRPDRTKTNNDIHHECHRRVAHNYQTTKTCPIPPIYKANLTR